MNEHKASQIIDIAQKCIAIGVSLVLCGLMVCKLESRKAQIRHVEMRNSYALFLYLQLRMACFPWWIYQTKMVRFRMAEVNFSMGICKLGR